jgi:small subunit ribosomal protein S1
VLSIDVEKERISLGVKQLEAAPASATTASFDKGSLVKGTVKSLDAKGATIDLGNEVEGYVRASEASVEKVEDIRTVLKEGDEIEAKVVSVDRKTNKVNLSIKAKDAADEVEAVQKYSNDSANAGTTNLGALLKAKMDSKSEQ